MESLLNKLTEEEARELLLSGVHIIFDNKISLGPAVEKDLNMDGTIEAWKEKGYIKGDPVEKAKRILNRLTCICRTPSSNLKISQMHRDFLLGVIEHLEKQVEELKK